MKKIYPIIMEKGEQFIIVMIPDFDINTQGEDEIQAIEMARDAIAMMGLCMEDSGQDLPEASDIERIKVKKGQIKTLIDVDFADYRRKNDLKTVKKNCTLPSWLCYEAEKMNINFSAVLQEALKAKIGIL